MVLIMVYLSVKVVSGFEKTFKNRKKKIQFKTIFLTERNFVMLKKYFSFLSRQFFFFLVQQKEKPRTHQKTKKFETTTTPKHHHRKATHSQFFFPNYFFMVKSYKMGCVLFCMREPYKFDFVCIYHINLHNTDFFEFFW